MSKNKKAYYFKMNLVAGNILALIIFFVTLIATLCIDINCFNIFDRPAFLLLLVLYFCLHEFLHGVGYFLGGGNRDKIIYGMCFEKGLLYCMDCEEISKKNILISLQMPFMVIGVITYIIGIIFHLPMLVILSLFNISGAALDLVMFFYIIKLKDVVYSESGNNDEFVLISSDNLEKKKNMFFKITEVKEYKKEDYVFKNVKKITVSKTSVIILMIILVITLLNFLFPYN